MKRTLWISLMAVAIGLLSSPKPLKAFDVCSTKRCYTTGQCTPECTTCQLGEGGQQGYCKGTGT